MASSREGRWWDTYGDDIPVVIGPTRTNGAPKLMTKSMMFPRAVPRCPGGLKRNVYCVDYGVGGRFHERHHGVSSDFKGRLAALLWRAPEAPTPLRRRELRLNQLSERLNTRPSSWCADVHAQARYPLSALRAEYASHTRHEAT